MGTRIVSQWKGSCPECENKWQKGEFIFFDGRRKNRENKKLACSNYECFIDQGGTFDDGVDIKNTVNDLDFFEPKFVNKEMLAELDKLDPILNAFIVKASKKVKELHPKLDPKDNTFGMIRNAMITHYKDLYVKLVKKI